MHDHHIRDVNELAERIALGQTAEALDLLRQIHPHTAPLPLHVLRRVADRQAEGRAHV